MKNRLDKILFDKNLAPSRTKAQDLIEQGSVRVNGQVITKSNSVIDLNADIEVSEILELKYVSRGGLKLDGAIEHCKLALQDLNALDVGISTGGFTDCLLQRGVKSVVGVDVGQNQLHDKLRNDSRVVSLEKVNARFLDQDQDLVSCRPSNGWQIAVVDVSFISLTLILEPLSKLINHGGFILALVKPQFEVGKEGLNKQGLVKNEVLYDEVMVKVKNCAAHNGFIILDYFESSIQGKDGNREFFIFLQRPPSSSV